MRNTNSKLIGVAVSTLLTAVLLVGCSAIGFPAGSTPEQPDRPTQFDVLPTVILLHTDTPAGMESTPSAPTPSEEVILKPPPGETAWTPTIPKGQKTQRPTRTPLPTRTPRPTKTATNTPTPLPPPIHDAPIRIYSPSSLSKVTSPFTLSAAVLPGYMGAVHMQLIGEDGTILKEKTWSDTSTVGWRMNINEKIEFTPRVAAESARLLLYTFDENKRMTALASEEIILMQFGKTVLTEPDNLKDPFALFKPFPEQNIKAGLLVVEGYVRCRVDCRLLFELIDRSGKQFARFEDPDVIQASLEYVRVYKSYKVDIKSPTSVRLIMHQQDIFTAEDLAVSSMVIRVLP